MKNKAHKESALFILESRNSWLRLLVSRKVLGGEQARISLKLPDNPEGRSKAREILAKLEKAYLLGQIQGNKKEIKEFLAPDRTEVKATPTIDQLWAEYTYHRSKQISESTIRRDYEKISKRIQKLSHQELDKAPRILQELQNNYSQEIARRTFEQINACCKWAKKYKKIKHNPFEDFVGELKRTQNSKPEAFKIAEMLSIIEAFQSDRFKPRKSAYKHSFFADYVQFLFLSGCRLEEAIALKWQHIGKEYIEFSEAYQADLKIRKTTKTKRVRHFPLYPALEQLLRQRKAALPLDQTLGESLVFSAQNGQEIDPGNFNNRYWKPVVYGLIGEGEVEKYLPPYNCRHTFITHSLLNGEVPNQVAEWVGNNVITLMKHYAGTDKTKKPDPYKGT